jgi:iron complex outermembrane receptor protein
MAALSQAALSVMAVHAQSTPASAVTLSEVVVTAARMPQDPTLLPIGVQVITGDEIRAAGLPTARDAIRWLGGVVSRSDTMSGREPVLDLRGFGDTSSSNVVILVDGVRQNEGDMNATVLAWIPVDSIERIEIVRGSGAVLHGEGATAGVINIITYKGLSESGGSASLALGSNATRDARMSLNTQTGSWRFQVHANAFDTDNHRDSFNTQERNALARATWTEGVSLWSVQLGGQSSKGHQPGGLTPEEFLFRPKFAHKSKDTSTNELGNLLLSGETQFGDWRVAADVNHRSGTAIADLQSTPETSIYKSNTETVATRGGVRAWRSFESGPVQQRLLLGMDAEQWGQSVVSKGYYFFLGSKIETAVINDIHQKSRAVYARHELDFKERGLKLFAGVRRTWSLRDAQSSDNGSPFGGGGLDAYNTSWELGAAQRLGLGGEAFTKLGTSFRLPNANEYTCFDSRKCSFALTSLQPQTSKDFAIGYRYKAKALRWSVNYYRHDLQNEIGYALYNNINFDPTRREGIEFDTSASLSKAVDASLQYAVRSAFFRTGVQFQGKDLPLVAHQSLTARLTYRQSTTQQWLLTSQWVSSQRIGDDFSNVSTSRVPGYGLVNLRYSHKVDAWTYAATANNLLDKRYFNYRTYSDETAKSVYPEAGRTFLVSAQRSF